MINCVTHPFTKLQYQTHIWGLLSRLGLLQGVSHSRTVARGLSDVSDIQQLACKNGYLPMSNVQ
jgi:hypothetical protein